MEKIVLNIPDITDLESIIDQIVERKIEKMKKHFSIDPNKILTRTDAAKFLNITPPTLDKYAACGDVKGYRLSGRPVYKQSELLNALKEIETLKFRRK